VRCVRGLENRMAGDIIDVAAGGDAMPPTCAASASLSNRHSDQRGDDIKIRGRVSTAGADVGMASLMTRPRRVCPPEFCTTGRHPSPPRRIQSSPVHNSSRERPSVYFMMLPLWQSSRLLLLRDGILNCRTHQNAGAGLRHRLDADPTSSVFRRNGFF